MTDQAEIRNAATIILVRTIKGAPSVLLGQRGANAAFMPSKFVFPGGAVDITDDFESTRSATLSKLCRERLAKNPVAPVNPNALANAAIRELWEETGLRLAAAGQAHTDAETWRAFVEDGLAPMHDQLSFFFRAITPPGRPRRFDARFFLANADAISDDLDDFSNATDELTHLQWVPILETREFNLPFITEVVLAELAAQLPNLGPPERLPFYDNQTTDGRFSYL